MKIHTFQIKIVETIQATREPLDEHRTKRLLETFEISVATDLDSAPPSYPAILSAFRSAGLIVAEKVGAK